MNCRLKLKTPHNFCYPHNFCITTKKKKKEKSIYLALIFYLEIGLVVITRQFLVRIRKKKLHNSKPLHVEQNCTPSKMPVTVPCLLHSAMQTYL